MPAVLMTLEDVVADLNLESLDVLRLIAVSNSSILSAKELSSVSTPRVLAMLRFLRSLFRSTKLRPLFRSTEDRPEWHCEQALIYPKESASAEELKSLGDHIQSWSQMQRGLRRIVGLQQLSEGRLPPLWIGGPIMMMGEEIMDADSLCCVVVSMDLYDKKLMSSLRDTLPQDLVSQICPPMPWN
jgi:hypothetical protein